MKRFLLHALLALVSLAVQCEANGQVSVEELQGTLEVSLARLGPRCKKEVEAYLAAVEQTPVRSGNFQQRFDDAAMAYLQSKGSEATETEAQRKQIIDTLESSCRIVLANLMDFERMDKAPLVEVDKASNIAKWRLALMACHLFIKSCSFAGSLTYNHGPKSCYNKLRYGY